MDDPIHLAWLKFLNRDQSGAPGSQTVHCRGFPVSRTSGIFQGKELQHGIWSPCQAALVGSPLFDQNDGNTIQSERQRKQLFQFKRINQMLSVPENVDFRLCSRVTASAQLCRGAGGAWVWLIMKSCSRLALFTFILK